MKNHWYDYNVFGIIPIGALVFLPVGVFILNAIMQWNDVGFKKIEWKVSLRWAGMFVAGEFALWLIGSVIQYVFF